MPRRLMPRRLRLRRLMLKSPMPGTLTAGILMLGSPMPRSLMPSRLLEAAAVCSMTTGYKCRARAALRPISGFTEAALLPKPPKKHLKEPPNR
jgi:hypothetical protein